MQHQQDQAAIAAAWARPPQHVDPSAAFFTVTIHAGGAVGSFILDRQACEQVIGWLDGGQAFRVWVDVESSGKSSGLYVNPRRSSVSIAMEGCTGIPINGQGRPVPDPSLAIVQAHPGHFAASLTASAWDGGPPAHRGTTNGTPIEAAPALVAPPGFTAEPEAAED